MDHDINKIDHIESRPEGCHTGVHDYEIDPSLPTGPKLQQGSGADTIMVVTCRRCNGQHSITAPLGLNEALSAMDSAGGPPPPERPRLPQYPQQEQPSGDAIGDEIMKKLGF
jgi:hypothetical protein